MGKIVELTHGCEIQAKELSVTYDDYVALRAADIKIRGNIIAVIGHNGAGKSTFMKALLGLLPYNGKLQTLHFSPERSLTLVPQRDMAFCPETGSVFADISVESYVKLWCRLKHNDGNYYKKAGSKYVDLLALAALLPKLGRELSKGQRRRVQTAIGFLSNPKLFFFDEPFDGLDVQKTNELAEIIKTHSSDISFVISSHRMDVMERLADTVAVLRAGEFISIGSVEKVCRELCAKSFAVSNVGDLEGTQSRLSHEFPELLITRIGNQLAVSGQQINLNALEAFVRSFDRNGVQITPAHATLTDAMNYHLRGLARDTH